MKQISLYSPTLDEMSFYRRRGVPHTKDEYVCLCYNRVARLWPAIRDQHDITVQLHDRPVEGALLYEVDDSYSIKVCGYQYCLAFTPTRAFPPYGWPLKGWVRIVPRRARKAKCPPTS